MDYHDDFCSSSAWQATLPSLVYNLRDEWRKSSNSSNGSCRQSPKKLTTEATVFLCIILFAVMLCIIASSNNAYESLRRALQKKKKSRKSKDQKCDVNEETQDERKIKLSEQSNVSVLKENFRKTLDCFCIQHNAGKLLGEVSNPEYMDFMDGIRTLFFLCIFALHFFHLYAFSTRNLHEHVHVVLKMPIVQFAIIVGFGIDAFFVLSGFLTAYSFSNSLEKNNGRMQWIPFYAFRIIRFTPVYIILLGVYATLFTYMSSSPVWPTYDTNPVCKETWMWNFLYISNYKSHWHQCMSMAWFLSCLMQLYAVSPFFMLPLNKSPRVGYVLSVVTICMSCFIGFIKTKKYNLFGSIPLQNNGLLDVNTRLWRFIDELHQNTFIRLTPYLIGILLGCHLHNRKLIKKNNWFTTIFGWISSIALMYFAFFALHDREESTWESAFYNSFKSLIFSCGFSWQIFVLATGQGGLIGKFLSCRIFKPISRLSFCGYLTQAIVLEGYFLTVPVLVDESFVIKGPLFDLSWVPILIHLLLWTLVLAFAAFLLIETPVNRLLKIYFIENKKKRS